jgi:hypothetical protein
MANGGDIIIKGSSVDIDYDNDFYPAQPGKRSHKNDKQAITRVTVEDAGGTSKYDSAKNGGADTSAWTITVYCKGQP